MYDEANRGCVIAHGATNVHKEKLTFCLRCTHIHTHTYVGKGIGEEDGESEGEEDAFHDKTDDERRGGRGRKDARGKDLSIGICLGRVL